jgi:hypothetical protein
VITGFYTFTLAYNWYNNWKYIYMLKFYDHYPPHLRAFLASKDHRHLLMLDLKNPEYTLHDPETKKSLY